MADPPSFEDLKSQFVLTAPPPYLATRGLVRKCFFQLAGQWSVAVLTGIVSELASPTGGLSSDGFLVTTISPPTATSRSFLNLANENSRPCGRDEQRSTLIYFFLV